jgi:hypothetical protein
MSEQRNAAATAHRNLATRRPSLVALGGAALAALTSRSPAAEAKKNKKSKSRKKEAKRCQKQGASCQEFATRLCALHHPPSPIRTACENRANACCASIEQCDGGEYFACLFDHLEDLEPV